MWRGKVIFKTYYSSSMRAPQHFDNRWTKEYLYDIDNRQNCSSYFEKKKEVNQNWTEKKISLNYVEEDKIKFRQMAHGFSKTLEYLCTLYMKKYKTETYFIRQITNETISE